MTRERLLTYVGSRRSFVKDTLNHHVNADKAKYAAGELDVDNPEALKAHFARSNDKFAASYDGASRPAGPKGKGKKKKSSAASDDSMLSDDDLMEVEESDASSQTSKRGKRKNAAAVRKTVAAASQSRGKKATTPLVSPTCEFVLPQVTMQLTSPLFDSLTMTTTTRMRARRRSSCLERSGANRQLQPREHPRRKLPGWAELGPSRAS